MHPNIYSVLRTKILTCSIPLVLTHVRGTVPPTTNSQKTTQRLPWLDGSGPTHWSHEGHIPYEKALTEEACELRTVLQGSLLI